MSIATDEHNAVHTRRFYIFGHNIAHSLSPTLHNAGFRELNLPYHYSIQQSEQVDATVEMYMARPDFGGASVTFPHKIQIGRLLDVISPTAEKVGAVNTVISKQTSSGRRLVGENTDWSGIHSCILRGGIKTGKGCFALVLGAGGAARAACYALQLLNVDKIVIVNRTFDKAKAVASHFSDTRFEIFPSLEAFCEQVTGRPRIIVACVPADDLTSEKIPASLFSSQQPSVLVEMAYRPITTGMMTVACRNQDWKVFRGTDVLVEQAFAQFELWTGKRAPIEVMRAALLRKTEEHI